MSDILLHQLTSGELANSGIIQHLSNLIREQISNKSELNGMSSLQVFSYYLRTHNFNFKQFMQDHQLNRKMNEPHIRSNYVQNVQRLSSKVKSLNNRKLYQRPNLMDEYHALKQCGISLGQTNYVHLTQVLKALATDNECSQIRFWGKILGYRDYYVIQGLSTKKYLNELGSDSENYGQGINAYSYWVSDTILDHWVELPLVTPLQVKQSRNFKYIFTGNLEQNINALGKFDGKEKHLLKCIVARITHGCEIVPKGLYKLNQQNPSILEIEEQFKNPQVAQMNSIENWVHLNTHILNQGRASYYIDPKLTEQQKEALTGQLGESDPMVQRLKGISQEKTLEALGYPSNWTVQLCGQTIPISLVGKQQGQSALYSSVLLKNLVWPGFATVGFKGGWTNIYVGFGQRISQVNTLIKQLGNLQIEGDSKKQFPEPNPKSAPVVKENPPSEEKQLQQDA